MSDKLDQDEEIVCNLVSVVIAFILSSTISTFIFERTDLYLKAETMHNENKRMEMLIENGWADERSINIKMKGEGR